MSYDDVFYGPGGGASGSTSPRKTKRTKTGMTVRELCDFLDGALDPGVACEPGVHESGEVTIWIPEGVEYDTRHSIQGDVTFDGVHWNVDLELCD